MLLTETHLQAFDAVVRRLGVSAYLCGGSVRDMLLNRPFHDVDVVLSDRVFEAADMFRAKLHAPSFVLDQERQVARVVLEQGDWDFSGFRNGTIEGDLAKRDFTINALAVPWQNYYPGRSLQRIIDPFAGLVDLRSGLIRTVQPESLNDDPLRMVRAYRIRAELHFQIDPSVLEQIGRLHPLIANVAAERITEEFNRLLLQPDAADTWELLGGSRLFDSIFPELKAMKGCEQGGYHHLDVWGHTVLALDSYEKMLPRLKEFFPDHLMEVEEYLDAVPGSLDRRRLLKWALLLHDAGKPQTRELKEPGRWRFHGHDHAGADLALMLLKRMKFARKDSQLISLIIDHHLRPLNLFNQEERSAEDFYRFFRHTGPEAIGVLLVGFGDLSAARGPLADPARDQEFLQMMRDLVKYYFEEYYPAVSTPELIKGRDLIGFLQMKPGPLVGQLLKEIREQQLVGALRDRDEALDFASRWLKNKS